MRRLWSFFFLSFFFFLIFAIPFKILAAVEISEIMYDLEGADSGREWIEIFNNSEQKVDLSGWRVFESGISHKIKIFGDEGEEDLFLNKKERAVIADNPAKFLEDWPNFSGKIFDSSFSLKNSGESIALLNNNLEKVDEVVYSSDWGAAGDGNSLQKLGPDWISTYPTPGRENKNSAGSDNDNNDNNENRTNETTDSGNYGENSLENTLTNPDRQEYFSFQPQIYAWAGEDKIAVVGAEVIFEGQALGLNKEPLEKARYLWNFGDGSTSEGKKVTHIYQYPSDYVVVLDVSSGQYSASDRLIAKILPNELKIVGANEDFIKLKNDSSFDLDLSGWYLKSGKILFKLPPSTIIKAKNTLPIISSISKIRVKKGERVDLLYPNFISAGFYLREGNKKTSSQNFFQKQTNSSASFSKKEISNPRQLSGKANFKEKNNPKEKASGQLSQKENQIGFSTSSQLAKVSIFGRSWVGLLFVLGVGLISSVIFLFFRRAQ